MQFNELLNNHRTLSEQKLTLKKVKYGRGVKFNPTKDKPSA